MRLDKFLADANLGTRSHVKTLIKHGFIKIDGEVIKNPAFNFDPQTKHVYFDDKLIPYEEEAVFLLNKPKDYICSTIAELYPSVLELLPAELEKRLKIVGRLDVDTTGTLLITTNGKLVNYLTHPKNNIKKKYLVTTNHAIPTSMIKAVLEPIDIGKGEMTRPCQIEIVESHKAYITLSEGKYHEIKRLFHVFNLEVLELDRIYFDKYSYLDKRLERGEFYKFNENELNDIISLVERN